MRNAGKDNDEYLKKMVLTGVHDFIQGNDESDFNSLERFDSFDEEFNKFYGFTEEEIKQYLLKDFFKENTIKNRNEILGKIKEWYNGYRISGSN